MPKPLGVMGLSSRNVNGVFSNAVMLVLDYESELTSVSPRGMRTLEWPYPVISEYERPTERVLFNAARDANPFFHFFEPLWMLAGRDDVAFVSHFVKRMAEFSDDGKRYHAAYGARWRRPLARPFAQDQLKALVSLLQSDPSTRRAVLQIWDADLDLDLNVASKDLPCNTHVYFKVRGDALNMTVCCRSNDILWGAYGANVTQFSTLQEYLANKIGVHVGHMVQLSDSWHVYCDGPGGALWEKLSHNPPSDFGDAYAYGIVRPFGLGAHSDAWDQDLRAFFEAFDYGVKRPDQVAYQTPYFKHVVRPMWLAWQHREPNYLVECEATDWRLAAELWLQRHNTKKVVA